MSVEYPLDSETLSWIEIGDVVEDDTVEADDENGPPESVLARR